ncbi:MAG: GNAT family N-acetyltransferase [Chloroflexaceae bacterium]|nr:GNAT family N-acetyltransferase [Chloroflexaceae bacterium]NJO06042.1 GNAT family N-acetyltransferase [Chloroflexaceae bacterium]
MLPAHQGNGYAAEAAQVIIDVVFTRLQGQRVVATTEHANLRSQRVMHKLGMHILKNTSQEPPWFEVVGILGHPDSRPA